MDKKLYKMEQGKKICGVCAGLADYLKMDVSLLRLIWVAVTLCGSIGFWIYLAAAIILPEKNQVINTSTPVEDAEDEEESESV